MSLTQESDFLAKVPLFKELEPAKLKLLAFASELITYRDGEELFHAGDIGDCAFVITAGEVEILSSADELTVVGVLQQNQLFGELALLNDEPRSATIRARGESTVMKITESTFMQLLRENSELALNVIQQLSQKLAKSHQHVLELQQELTSGNGQ